MSQCACGCGSEITRYDPSPDFKYIQCHLLWLASQAHPDPAWRRAKQRYLHRLVSVESRWSECYWEDEITDRYITLFDPAGVSYEDGLAVLIQRYVAHFRTAAPQLDIDVLAGGPGSATPGV